MAIHKISGLALTGPAEANNEGASLGDELKRLVSHELPEPVEIFPFIPVVEIICTIADDSQNVAE